MPDRIDRYLEGKVDRSALTPQERAEAETVTRVAQEARNFVSARPAPDLTAHIMRRIEHLGPPDAEEPPESIWVRLTKGLWTPREVSLRFRPAYGLLAIPLIAALLMILAPLSRPLPRGEAASTVATPRESRLLVQFRLEKPNASDVRLAGSFTNWQPTYRLHETAPGLWTVTLPLAVGVHEYVFVVDGEQWVTDPYAQQVDDGFGGVNSRIALLLPETPRS